MGAAAQAARERARPHWLTRGSVRRCRASRARASRSAMPTQQVDLAPRPRWQVGTARAAARTRTPPRSIAPTPRGAPAIDAEAAPARCRRSRRRAASRFALARHPHPRLHLVPRVGRRHAVPGRARRRVHQGRVEEPSRHAARRHGAGRRPRGARRRPPAPLPGVTDPDMGGQFNNKNPGKRGISLNVRHPKGLEIAQAAGRHVRHRRRGLLARACSTAGGSATTSCSEIKPDIIYVQQSGMGAQGTYGRLPHRRADRRLRSPARRRCRDCPSPRCRPAGAIPTSTGWAPTASRSRCSARCTIASAPARASGSTPRRREVGHLHRRHGDPRLVGQRPRLDAHRQPLALQAGGAARRLSAARATTAGSRSPASPTSEWRALAKVAGHAEWARRSALRDARRPARPPGCARCAGRRRGRGRSDAYELMTRCRRPACRPASARPPRIAATTIRSCGTSNG